MFDDDYNNEDVDFDPEPVYLDNDADDSEEELPSQRGERLGDVASVLSDIAARRQGRAR